MYYTDMNSAKGENQNLSTCLRVINLPEGDRVETHEKRDDTIETIFPPFGCKESCSPSFKGPNLAHKKGTTTLGMLVRDGIVMAVDSRASTGQYIASQTVMKLLVINDYMLGTMAGGAADCQFWFRVLSQECRLWELRTGNKISVKAASKILSNAMYQYRHHDLSMGSMVAGYNVSSSEAGESFSLYYIDDQGDRIRNNIFCVGSGSIYAYGVLDAEYDYNMSIDQAADVARRAVYHATHRDCFSGGFISVYSITKDGWKKITRDDQTSLHARYKSRN